MQPEKIFKRYDVRGRYPNELDEEFAERLGKSVGEFVLENFGKEEVVVCRDNKDSSVSLKNSLIEGLRSSGADVVDVGVGPTDYAAFCGKSRSSVSVQVTSSHMPLDFNGFKFMYPEGNGFVNEDLNALESNFRENKFSYNDSGKLKEAEFKESYLDALVDFAKSLNLDWSGKEIVVDCLGGSSLPFVYEALDRVGCDVYCVDTEEEGQSLEDFSPYRDPPNPEEEQLELLKHVVDERDADLGLGFDLDGDRVSVYHDGGFVSGDEVFAILSSITDGSVVGSIDTASCVEGVVRGRGDDIYYTRVGDPFVLSEALEKGATLAGEPNGHYSFLDFVPYNSGCLVGVILAGVEDLSDERDSVSCNRVLRESVNVEDKNRSMGKVKDFVENSGYEVVSNIDGLKFRYEDSIVLVRTSGSSDKLRFVIEAESGLEPEFLFDDMVEKIF